MKCLKVSSLTSYQVLPDVPCEVTSIQEFKGDILQKYSFPHTIAILPNPVQKKGRQVFGMFTLLDLGIQKYCVRYIKCQSWVTWKSRKLRVVMKQTFLLDREYLLELRQRKYKQGLAFQGEHRAAVCICREKRKPKAHLELTKVVSNKKKKALSMLTARRGLRKTLD